MVRLSFKTRPQDSDWASLQAVWEEAEAIPALDAGWLFDHFYPIYVPRTDGPCFEGWVALTYLAGVVQRLRLGVMVTGNTYRHPAVLANMAATLDVVSGGRLEIGIGAGWNEEEHAAYGIALPPPRERMDRLDEACAVLDGLLTQETTTFEGRYYQLREARCEPKPVQRPRPPLVLGRPGQPAAGDHRALGGRVELQRVRARRAGRAPRGPRRALRGARPRRRRDRRVGARGGDDAG